MKELLNKTNKGEWVVTIAYKISIFICWYLFAYIFTLFLHDSITDAKLILMVLSLIIIYAFRLFLKNLYKRTANDSYYNLKHAIEMHYFNKIKKLSYSDLEKIDKELLANRIIEVAYNYTKIVCDIGECLIPALLGAFILCVKLISINEILGIFTIIILASMLYINYSKIEENKSVTNYNDLLKELILKMNSIKKLNIFDYCSYKLDKNNKENDMCILKNNETNLDHNLTFTYVILMSLILISTFIFINNTVTRLGIIIFIIMVSIKLQELLYRISPAIKNMFASSRNKAVLDEYFKNEENIEVENVWKKILIKDGVVNYKDTTLDIKIPSFELVRKDSVSIMGKSGEGKSTVLNILSGIFKLDKGTLSYDDIESNKIVDAVYISSNSDVFTMSLRDNLMMDKYETDEVIESYLKDVGLDTWYQSLDNKLDTLITDEIDQSIKNRINLIRSIIMDKEVYLFDEPTLDLSLEEEKKVAAFIKKKLKDKTYIVISKSSIITTNCKKHYFIKDHTLLEKEPLL